MWGARTIAAFVLVVTLVATDSSIARAAPERQHRPTPARLETFELPTSLVDPSMPGGRLEHDRAAPKVNVLLPVGYDDHPHRRYPVLWLLHGANGGTDTWVPGITTLAAGLDAVVVMPDGGLLGMYTDWWNGGARRDPAWATYHLQVLRRTIEDRYRLRPERSRHAIAGISMGGQGALRYAALLPGYFGSVVGFSAAVPDMQSFEAQLGIQLAAPAVDPRITYERIFGPADGEYAAGNSPRALAANLADTRLYLTSGNGTNCSQDPKGPTFGLDTATELIINAQQGPFAADARAAGADVTEVTTCGVHTFGVWDRAFAAARAWGFFAPVPERPRAWTYRTIATTGEMWNLRFRFSEPPATVASFRRSGHWLGALGSGEVVIDGPRGCRLEVELPFLRRLPAACQPSS